MFVIPVLFFSLSEILQVQPFVINILYLWGLP